MQIGFHRTDIRSGIVLLQPPGRRVEKDESPHKLMAERRHSSGKVIQTLPILPIPKVARYKGIDSADDAANFELQRETRQIPL